MLSSTSEWPKNIDYASMQIQAKVNSVIGNLRWQLRKIQKENELKERKGNSSKSDIDVSLKLSQPFYVAIIINCWRNFI